MKRLSVGDKVKVCQLGFRVPYGSVGRIINDDHSSVPFLVDFDGSYLWMTESQVELVELAQSKPTRQLKVGDTVRIKSRQWYDNADKDGAGDIRFPKSSIFFGSWMVDLCGTTHNIIGEIRPGVYRLDGCGGWSFIPEMFDLVETPSLTDRIKDFFTPARKPTTNGNIPLIKRNKLLTNIKLD